MGLDAYFYETTPDNVVIDAGGNMTILNPKIADEIAYFRKFHALQELLLELWLDDNPDRQAQDFNCTCYQMDKVLLEYLERFARDSIDDYENSDYDLDDDNSHHKWCYLDSKELLIVCRLMAAALDDGQVVYYYNWY